MLRKFLLLFFICPLIILPKLLAQDGASNSFEIIDSRSIKNVCHLPPTNTNAHFFVRSNKEVLERIRAKSQTTFQVDFFSSCNGNVWPQEAVTAFEFALAIWAEHISSNVPIKVNANWIDLEGNTLGSASPTRIVQISGAGEQDTWYTLAQLSALADQPIREQLADEEGNPIQYDINMNVKCNYDRWYFGTDARVPENRSDFVTVILHEIGHGLGFLGTVEADNATDSAAWGTGSNNPNPLIYDRYVVDGNFNYLIDESIYPNPSTDLYDALIGENGGIFFEGVNTNRSLTGQQVNRAKLYSPNPFNDGSSYSHFDQIAFRQSINALMLPFIDREFALHTPGPLFCGVLSDMGWPMGEGCIDMIPSGIILTDQPELSFGVLKSGEKEEKIITISNRGDAEIPLNGSLSVDLDQFSISGNQSFSIQPGSSQEFSVLFDPNINKRHQANLSITHDAGNVPSPLQIPLEGESLGSRQMVQLDQSYPNPFVLNNNTNTEHPIIEFAISERSRVKLDLFSVSGQYLRPIVDADLDPRRYSEVINMTGLSSGVYIYRIVVNGTAKSGKLMYVR